MAVLVGTPPAWRRRSRFDLVCKMRIGIRRIREGFDCASRIGNAACRAGYRCVGALRGAVRCRHYRRWCGRPGCGCHSARRAAVKPSIKKSALSHLEGFNAARREQDQHGVTKTGREGRRRNSGDHILDCQRMRFACRFATQGHSRHASAMSLNCIVNRVQWRPGRVKVYFASPGGHAVRTRAEDYLERSRQIRVAGERLQVLT
jgi:hypothetical protein